MANSNSNFTSRVLLTLLSLTVVVMGIGVWRYYVANLPEYLDQAIVRAIVANNMTQVKRYLKQGANPNAVFRYLDEPWQSRGFTPAALWIRLRGGPGAPSVRNGPTALTKAVMTGNPAMVRLLLTHGAEVHRRDQHGWAALNKAYEIRNSEIVEILQQASAKE